MNYLRNFSKFSIYNLISSLLLIIFIFGFARDLIIDINDWDLDGEMYFGSRLLHGELIFVSEFHDKLPFVQFLFSFLSITKNKILFTLLNGFINILAALSYRSYLTSNKCNEFTNIPKEYLIKIANLFSSIFLTLSIINPGSLNTISSISSGLNLLAIGFLLGIKKDNLNSFSINKFCFIVFGGMAISIRPYLLFNILLLPLWRYFSLDLINSDHNKRIHKVFNFLKNIFLSWTLPLFIFGVILNVSPYFLSNNFESIYNGIKFNSQELVPASILLGFKLHVYHSFATLTNLQSFLTLFSCLFGIIYLIKIFKNSGNFFKVKSNIDIGAFAIIFPILIYFSISFKHMWDHYWHLYTPYLILSLTYIFLGEFKGKNFLINRTEKLFLKMILVSLCLAILKPDIYKIAQDLSKYGQKHLEYEKKNIVLEYINNQDLNEKKFLYPDSTYIHWQLNQNRHGFPHSANILHIKKGFWNDVSKYGFNLPTNLAELCDMYQNSGPEIIILDDIDSSYTCLNSEYSNYYLDKQVKTQHENNVYFFKRRNKK